MDYPVVSSFCGLELRTGGLIIGYTQFFLSIIMLNNEESVGPMTLFYGVNMILAVPFILGILTKDPSYMRLNIIWGKAITMFSLILCLWFGLWDFAFVVGFITNTVSQTWAINNMIIKVHVAWIIFSMITVVSWYLVSLMESLCELIKEAALKSTTEATSEKVNPLQEANVGNAHVDDVPADEHDTLITFRIYRNIRYSQFGIYTQKKFESLEKYFDKLTEYVTRNVSYFIELPVKTPDIEVIVHSNDSNAQTDATTLATHENVDECSITMDTETKITTNQSDAASTQTV